MEEVRIGQRLCLGRCPVVTSNWQNYKSNIACSLGTLQIRETLHKHSSGKRTLTLPGLTLTNIKHLWESHCSSGITFIYQYNTSTKKGSLSFPHSFTWKETKGRLVSCPGSWTVSEQVYLFSFNFCTFQPSNKANTTYIYCDLKQAMGRYYNLFWKEEKKK